MAFTVGAWRWPLAAALAGGVVWVGAQPSVNPAPNPAKAHHTANGFQNRYGGNDVKSQWEVLKWQLSRSNPPIYPGWTWC